MPGTGPLSWVWWPEKTDLVFGLPFPLASEGVIAAIDGKVPSVVDHPIAQELRKSAGTFQPVCVAFIDTAGSPTLPAGLDTLVNNVKQAGINRLDYQWGFDGEALMTVTRVVAPKPWKNGLALFDQPTFDKTSLMPMPESVSSFVELSISPSKLLDTLEKMGAPGEFQAQVDKLSQRIKNAGQIDLRKRCPGPSWPAYGGLSCAWTIGGGQRRFAGIGPEKRLDSRTAAVTAMQSYLPKLTVVAQVDDPVAFGKALDTVVIAINGELEAQARARRKRRNKKKSTRNEKAAEPRAEAKESERAGAASGPSTAAC